MNWLLLITACHFEVGFATCLGKVKETTGLESKIWFGGFFSDIAYSKNSIPRLSMAENINVHLKCYNTEQQ